MKNDCSLSVTGGVQFEPFALAGVAGGPGAAGLGAAGMGVGAAGMDVGAAGLGAEGRYLRCPHPPECHP